MNVDPLRALGLATAALVCAASACTGSDNIIGDLSGNTNVVIYQGVTINLTNDYIVRAFVSELTTFPRFAGELENRLNVKLQDIANGNRQQSEKLTHLLEILRTEMAKEFRELKLERPLLITNSNNVFLVAIAPVAGLARNASAEAQTRIQKAFQTCEGIQLLPLDPGPSTADVSTYLGATKLMTSLGIDVLLVPSILHTNVQLREMKGNRQTWRTQIWEARLRVQLYTRGPRGLCVFSRIFFGSRTFLQGQFRDDGDLKAADDAIDVFLADHVFHRQSGLPCFSQDSKL